MDIKYYDLGILNRDATDDRVTVESAEATLKYVLLVEFQLIFIWGFSYFGFNNVYSLVLNGVFFQKWSEAVQTVDNVFLGGRLRQEANKLADN